MYTGLIVEWRGTSGTIVVRSSYISTSLIEQIIVLFKKGYDVISLFVKIRTLTMQWIKLIIKLNNIEIKSEKDANKNIFLHLNLVPC